MILLTRSRVVARDFMSTKVVGHVNIALIFGLLQFVSTFLIAWFYARYAARKIDPLADRIKAELTGDTAPVEKGVE